MPLHRVPLYTLSPPFPSLTRRLSLQSLSRLSVRARPSPCCHGRGGCRPGWRREGQPCRVHRDGGAGKMHKSFRAASMLEGSCAHSRFGGGPASSRSVTRCCSEMERNRRMWGAVLYACIACTDARSYGCNDDRGIQVLREGAHALPFAQAKGRCKEEGAPPCAALLLQSSHPCEWDREVKVQQPVFRWTQAAWCILTSNLYQRPSLTHFLRPAYVPCAAIRACPAELAFFKLGGDASWHQLGRRGRNFAPNQQSAAAGASMNEKKRVFVGLVEVFGWATVSARGEAQLGSALPVLVNGTAMTLSHKCAT